MKKLGVLVCFLMIAWTARADMTVRSIRVTGNQRLEPATVLSYLPFEEGETITSVDLNKALKDLYKTGFFDDVEMKENGDELTIHVKERPIISYIGFEGNDKIDEDVLAGEVQTKVRDVYTPTKIRADVARLETIYRRMGLFSAKITSQVENKSQNRVEVIFKIDEGPKNYIQDIYFKGNTHFSSGDLREVLMSKEKRWYRFLSSTDTYDPDRLNYDKELLRRFYLRKGYVDFDIKDMIVKKDDKTGNFIITFDLNEGARYRFGSSSVKVTLPDVDAAKLQKQIAFKAGAFYNADLIEETIQNITDELGRL